jgi:hypothetical protein
VDIGTQGGGGGGGSAGGGGVVGGAKIKITCVKRGKPNIIINNSNPKCPTGYTRK